MPLQNRVTPFGEIVAVSARGMFTGNRGIIHDPQTRTLLRRRWATKSWITCACDYKGVRRQVMADRSWTELFFLDEATALSAGHRPCFLCRREAANEFRAAWCRGNAVVSPRAAEIDDILHSERLEADGSKRRHPVSGPVESLPDGAMVEADGEAFLVINSSLLRWRADGYSSGQAPRRTEWLLTPPSTLAALACGYRPVMHPTARSPRT
ncbi:hypothetical protein OIU34_21355 [Pararhizobium sp. BT-229]|uniref:hypothetical protein n=1 Tax=Pararhizobium sp. BT-229 TaxID=2986923 RepID=UPI0021F7DF6F|nr:hypothetical protein [Pararhizobium sp. BT-229]MCV9964440.1 hypothetical protein [Pararhizobium sp. BT-229]